MLRAAELDGDWLDGVVAGEPNGYVESARPLYDYATEAAIFMPCALLHMPADALPQPALRTQAEPLWQQRCASLKAKGLIERDTVAKQAASAHAHLRANGWSDASLAAGAASTGCDLWRAVTAAYGSAYSRYRAGEHPCGFSYTAVTPQFQARPSTAAERNTWWSESAGIPPSNGITLRDPRMTPPDSRWKASSACAPFGPATALTRNACVMACMTPAQACRVAICRCLPSTVKKMAWCRRYSAVRRMSRPRAAGNPVGYWQVGKAEHFDALLAFPSYPARFVPLLPYMYAGLDRCGQRLKAKRKSVATFASTHARAVPVW